MSELPTVEIVNEAAASGFTRINEADFDPAIHKLYGSDPFTRDAIEAMTDKAEILDLIEAHGGKPDKRRSVDVLRGDLLRIMFMED